ncbi:MAG: 1-deoxy-D-xylulose-5-phosphate reductoisomerase [Desulfobacterales bacterium]|nr:1-deoxy-D-xylulose-5-phosphate reductoisomerase [Desulfobacterales bacterium]MDX2512878.1 1-deoxy-D-xylulose-5-phosphate reductoisomerase [Desulfobacterales bacterium]
MKNLTILGSTGSIGTNALKVVAQFPERFTAKVLTAGQNISKLVGQIKQFQPELVAVFDEAGAAELERALPKDTRVEIVYGSSGYQTAAAYETSDMVLTAVVGAAGLMPTISAIEAGKNIALANKETLVMAGELIMQLAQKNGVDIIPVDSEHSAIFQCLMGQRTSDLDVLLITASGGPFMDTPVQSFPDVSPEAALNHPNWQMGRKITIDSATLMNKGLEVIEAKHLFQVEMDRIRVVVHPQSIIHSMVSFQDGSVLAQLGIPDMKGAIALALSFPERLPLGQPLPDFADIGCFTFKEPDMEKFSCLGLAMKAGRKGGTLPTVLNAANEVAVHAFLEHRLSFDQIPLVIEKSLAKHTNQPAPSLEDILTADQWAREAASRLIESGSDKA